jgi:hypothetical protein
MIKAAFAEISTWVGMSIGAFHTYVKIKYEDKDFELKHPLTQKEATELNKVERDYLAGTFRYKRGDEYRGFWTLEKARKATIDWFREALPDYDVLFEGSPSNASVKECLFAKDENLCYEVNKLYNRAERLGFYNYKTAWDEMAEIDKAFNELIKEQKND